MELERREFANADPCGSHTAEPLTSVQHDARHPGAFRYHRTHLDAAAYPDRAARLEGPNWNMAESLSFGIFLNFRTESNTSGGAIGL